MEITQIKYFLEVAESEHITSSAEKLHIAQPALSQAIKRLEDELGVPLFEKNGRNIVITKYGRYLQKKLTPFIETVDKLPEDLAQMASVEKKTIYINVLAASTLITNAIIEYKTRNNDVIIKLLQNSEEDQYDIEITTKLFYQQDETAGDRCFVCPERIFLAVPNSEKYADVKSISLKDAEAEDFISLMGSRQFRYICDKFCRHAEIKPRYVFESDNPAAVQNMIAAKMGVGFWPEFSWGKLQNKNVKLLPISDTVCSRDIIVSLNKSSENDCAADFYNFLKCYLQRKAK